jgi:hypothetical protein
LWPHDNHWLSEISKSVHSLRQKPFNYSHCWKSLRLQPAYAHLARLCSILALLLVWKQWHLSWSFLR